MGRNIWRPGAAIVVVTLTLTTAIPADAASPRQEQSGDVTVASGPPKAGPVLIAACGLADAMAKWTVDRGRDFASEFTIEPKTRGRRFTLTPSTPADLAITFREGYSWVRVYDGRSLDGENGRVPKRATDASVCLVAGPPTGFRYQAG